MIIFFLFLECFCQMITHFRSIRNIVLNPCSICHLQNISDSFSLKLTVAVGIYGDTNVTFISINAYVMQHGRVIDLTSSGELSHFLKTTRNCPFNWPYAPSITILALLGRQNCNGVWF